MGSSSKKGIWIFLIVILIVFITAIIAGSVGFFTGKATNQNTDSDIFFESPEDAVVGVFGALKKGNTDQAIQMFGVQKKTQEFDLESYIERIQCITPQTLYYAGSNESTYFQPLSLVNMKSLPARQLTYFALKLILSGQEEADLFTGMTITPVENDLVEKLNNANDISALEDLELKQIFLYQTDYENYDENNEYTAEIYGSNTMVDILVVFKYKSEKYVITLSLMECEEGYFINSLNSPILGADSSGVPYPYEEWEESINNGDGNGEYELIWED